MSSYLESLSAVNEQPDGMRVVIFANEKMGKTNFAASAPNPIIIPLEVGYVGLDRTKVAVGKMLTNYAELLTTLSEFYAGMQAGTFPFKTIVFDSATALERMIHETIIAKDPNFAAGKAVTMESVLGGYGKGYTHANDEFSNFLKWCDLFAVHYKINIVLTSHAFASKTIDPTSGEFDTWDILLHSPKNMKQYGKREIVTQWADVVGFLYEPMFITESDNISKGVSQNKGRVLGVSRTPSYVAGNRYRVVGEIPIPMEEGWNHLAHAIHEASGFDYYKR